MSLTLCVYETKTTTTESVSGGPTVAATVTHSQFNTEKRLTPTSTPPATVHAAGTFALSAGAGTMDLTALANGPFADVDLTGLKVQVAKFKAKATNASPVTIAPGGSNPYSIFGSDFSITLQPGQEVCFYGNDDTPDVASGAKNIDFDGVGTGTGTEDQEAVEYVIVAG